MTDAERAELSRLRQIETNEFKSPTALAAENAWSAVRRVDDASWANLPMEIRHKLTALAEKALAGRAEQEGDYAPAGFFAAVSSTTGQWFDVHPETERLAIGRGAEFSIGNTTEKELRGVVRDEIPDAAVAGDTSTHAPNSDVQFADPNGPPVPHGDGSPPPNVLDGDVRPRTEFPPLPVDERADVERLDALDGRFAISDLQSANKPESEFPALHPSESAAHLSNGTVAPSDSLPDNFPGRLPLGDAGVNTFGQLRERLASGVSIPGVGPALNAEIEQRLSE